ncbi:unnamed protein product [Somion occarium]|uniref:Uncharacterized protein n=1 Tax=Somion occarium TaxID=3059160 RepID=A0ABP1DGH1_9APHY
MLLLRRDRRPADDSSPGNSPIAYRRTSIPSISAISITSSPSSSTLSSGSQRRAPLATLHTQPSATAALDDQMSASSSSQYAYSIQDTSMASDPKQDLSRLISRPIATNRSLNDDPNSLPPPRKRSIPGHNGSNRATPYPQSRSTQRRPSNTSIATASSGRRTSLPAIHAHAPPVVSIQTENTFYPLPNTADDLYSGLSTFTFGVPLPSSSYPADTSDMISPLTQVPGNINLDRTPRPSISGPSGTKPPNSYTKTRHGKQKVKDHLDPDMGDDEYEDEDDAVRQKSRSKMRAIDDGSRRPSLPTNVYIPDASDPSAPASPVQVRQQRSPGTGSELDSGVDDSEADPEDGDQGELDTDVEFDLQGHNAVDDSTMLSDSASQHTFGVSGGFDYYGYRQGNILNSERMSINEEDGEDSDSRDVSVSPVTFSRHEYDSEGPEVDTFYVGPEQPSPERRGSVPWNIPGAVPRDSISGPSRDREDSMATITARRASRSMDDDLNTSPVDLFNNGAASHPETKADFRSLEAHGLAQQDESEQLEFQQPPFADDEQQPVVEGPANDVYHGFNMDYILSGPQSASSRRSWAPSMVHPGSSMVEGRRPSTFTTASGEDAFTKHLRDADDAYNERRLEWSFRMESNDGKGPRASTAALGPLSKAEMRKPMEPGTQEIWRQAHIGRFKVDRLLLKSDQPDKAPQQRVNIRHIADPFSLENKRGGPHSVIHKHSRAVAFSIFRAHSLFSQAARRRTPSHMSASISILLATKKVQEQYTSTRTTSKLNSHGLLEDRPHRPGASLAGTTATNSSKDNVSQSSRSGRSKSRRRHEDGNASSATSGVGTSSHTTSVQSTASTSASSAMAKSPSRSPEPSSSQPQSPVLRQADNRGHATSLSYNVTDPFPSPVESRPSASSPTNTSNAPAKSPSELTQTSMSSRTAALTDRMDLDDDELDPPRTSHAEAFATVDSSYLEYVRGRSEQRPQEDMSSHSLVGALRRKLLGQGGNKVSSRPTATGTSTAALEGNYTPPWLTMAPRSKQEERERVIQTLNESFKDVGLLPSFKPSKPYNPKHKSRKNASSTNIFANVPSESLYMLLPLWPGETDQASAEQNEDPATYIVPVEERQYLLVYYVPFQEDPKKKKGDKKRTRAETHVLSNSSSSHNGAHISLSSFRVCARLVCYADLRETGVRLPDYGLSVTGSMTEATKYLPPKSIREKALDDVIIGGRSYRGG